MALKALLGLVFQQEAANPLTFSGNASDLHLRKDTL